MVQYTGAERLTFEILRIAREHGAAVHCVVNTWDNKNIAAAAERIGATWSTGYYWYRFDRHTRNPIKHAQFAWDVLLTSLGLLRDSWRVRPTHIFMPEFLSVLRNAPALALLRALGVKVILRLPNNVSPGRFYQRLWGKVLPRFVDWFVPNSRHSERLLVETGAPRRKIVRIANATQRRAIAPGTDAEVIEFARARPTLLCVGQIAPYKGTHCFVEAALALIAEGRDLQAALIGDLVEWPPGMVEYQDKLKAQIEAAGAGDRVRFFGHRNNVIEIMRNCFLLAAPIVADESFGNVVLEAKSAGLPQAIFATGGVPELVEHKATGYICEGHETPDLVRGIKHYLDDPAERERASAACLAFFETPDCEYVRSRFERSWLGLIGGFDEPHSAAAPANAESPIHER